MRLAYLNTEYPSLSHTFIEREVRVLRTLGVDVQTYSVRRPDVNGMLSEHHRKAAVETIYLLDGWRSLAKDVVLGLLKRPRQVVRTLVAAQRFSPPGTKQRIRHLFYAIEAIRLAREMNKGDLKHVHVHMGNNGAMVARLLNVYESSITYSLTIHGPAEFFNVEDGRLKIKAEHATFVRCISNFCKSQVMTWTDPSAWSKYHVVPCGIEIGENRRTVKKEGGPIRILTVGRIVAVKGYPVLLRACRILSDRGIDWRLTMIGEGAMRASLEKMSESIGIADRINMVGAVGQDEIMQYYNEADLMVLSSFMEGVPVVLMEAMACELPVVATNVGGVSELVKSGQNGWLVPPADADVLAEAIAEAAMNPKRRWQYGQQGREDVVRRHDIRQVANAMKELFTHYLSKQSSMQKDAITE